MYFPKLTHSAPSQGLWLYLSPLMFRGRGLQAWKIQKTTTIESNDAHWKLLQWCADLQTCMIHFGILFIQFYKIFVNFSVPVDIYKTHTCTCIHFVFVSDVKDPLTSFCSLIGSGITAFKSTTDLMEPGKPHTFKMQGFLCQKYYSLAKLFIYLNLSLAYA